MEINERTINFKSRKDWFHLVPIGDIHLGNIGCDVEKLKEMIDWIKEKDDVYWIGMGDYLDCINYTDKRFDPCTIAKQYREYLSNCVPMQIQDLIDLFKPIANKCIGLHRGNHEETIRLHYHYDVLYELWKEFKVPMLNDTAITRLRFNWNKHGGSQRCVFDIFSTHGHIGGRKGGGKINYLEDMIGFVDADVYLMGHSHIKATETKSTLYVDNMMNFKNRKRVLAVTGSYLRGYQQGSSSYVEKWGYPPSDIGVVKIMFNPDKHDVHISE